MQKMPEISRNQIKQYIENKDFNSLRDMITQRPELLKESYQDNMPLMHWAAAQDQATVLALCLKHDSDLTLLQDEEGNTPLMLAALNSASSCVAPLLNANPRALEIKNTLGMSVAHIMITNEDIDALALAIKCSQSAGVNLLSISDQTGISVAFFMLERSDDKMKALFCRAYPALFRDSSQFSLALAQFAVRYGLMNDLKLCLRQNPDLVNQVDSTGRTLAINAAELGQADILTLCIEANPAVMAQKNPQGRTPTQIAVQKGHADVIRACMRQGYQYEKQAIRLAIETENVDALKICIEIWYALTMEISEGLTAASYAAKYGYIQSLKTCINRKPEVLMIKDDNRMTPALLAAENGQAEALKICLETDSRLLKASYDSIRKVEGQSYPAYCDLVDQVTYCDRSAAILAARNGHTEALKICFKANPALVAKADIFGRTPAMYAAENGHSAALEVCIKENSDALSLADQDGNTAFLFAAKNAHIDALKACIDASPSELNRSRPDRLKPKASRYGKQETCLFTECQDAPVLHQAIYKDYLAQIRRFADKATVSRLAHSFKDAQSAHPEAYYQQLFIMASTTRFLKDPNNRVKQNDFNKMLDTLSSDRRWAKVGAALLLVGITAALFALAVTVSPIAFFAGVTSIIEVSAAVSVASFLVGGSLWARHHDKSSLAQELEQLNTAAVAKSC